MPPALVLQSAHHTNDLMNQATMDGNLLSLSQPLANSSIAIPNLETIPGSAAATPALRDSPPALSSGPPPAEAGPSRHPLAQHSFPSTPDADSRRSSISSFLPHSGSYFPARSSAASTESTPSERPRPTPINIPAGTPDEPLFSAYPDTFLSPPNKNRNFTFPLQSAFQLSPVAPRSRRDEVGDEGGSRDSSSSAVRGEERDRSKGSRNRRRAATLSHLSPEPDTQRTSSIKVTRLSVTPTRSLKVFRRRRSSLSSVQPEFGNDPSTQWPRMAREEARRLEPPPTVPFSYQQSSDSDYTLQSISTIATVRPLASPSISPRRSSLVALPDQHDGGGILNLSQMPDAQGGLPVGIVVPEDMTMPHEPPPRRSSLSLDNTDPKLLLEVRPADPDAQNIGLSTVSTAADGHSVLSASLTGTDTSASAEYYSTSPSSKEHPLSSASTSLSRSAKSGKEGADDKDEALTVLRLQRSLEWEARQGQHRRQLEKRKMVLLELVETEVAYVEDLKALVQIYLPQLYALPSISQRTAGRVARNAGDLLEFHVGFAQRMVAVLREEDIGYEPRTEDSAKLERTARRLSELFVDEIAGFGAYKEFCAGSIAAATLVRHISMRSDYNDFEKRCQYITSKQTHTTLHSLLADDEAETTSTNRSRLHFRDFLITPVQRICRYPLLLAQLLNSAQLPDPEGERPTFDVGDEYDVGVDIERALGAMRGAAEDADEARRVKEVEIKSATVIERLEPHPALSPPFLRSLGACRLIGSLDVLYHHPTLAPLMAPVKVKYLAAFLYRGYLILAKVKKGKSYEAKHYFPLEVFELIDITEGFLPHSIRLVLREHNFDLAASCEAEKDVWSAALCEARDESTVPPFELPASVSPFAARSRRVSLVGGQNSFDFTPPMPSPSNKRHTLAGAPSDLPFQLSIESTRELTVSPSSSPTQTSFDTPDRQSNPQSNAQSSTVLLRRASAAQRLIVDRALMDVFSESCATARSKAQLQRPLFIPDHPVGEPRDRLWKTDSPTIQRRRSFLDVRPYGRPGSQSIDIAFSGKIRGSVVRRTHSSHGKRHVARRREVGSESATEVEGRQSADETVMSDFGTLMGREYGGSTSIASDSPLPSPLHQPRSRRSIPSLRRGSDEDTQLGASSSWTGKLTLNRRKTASTYYLNSRPHAHDRSKSMPVSPARTPGSEMPPPPTPLFKSVSEEPTLRKAPSGYFDGQVPSPSPANAPPADRTAEGSKGTWANLRRSMSFIRSGPSSTRFSQVSLVDLSPSPARTSDERPVSERAVSSDDEIDGGAQRDAGTIVESASSGSGFAAEADGDGGASGGTGSLPGTPRRRRSTRLLRSLSRFTPFEMVQ